MKIMKIINHGAVCCKADAKWGYCELIFIKIIPQRVFLLLYNSYSNNDYFFISVYFLQKGTSMQFGS